MLEFVKPTEELINYIADNMRQEDAEEVMISDGHSPVEALMRGWLMSDYSVVATWFGVPLTMFGVVGLCITTGCGSPWLLSSKEILKHKKALLKMSPVVVKEMLSLYPRLVNYVYTGNTLSVRWLRWLGFSFDDPKPYGVQGKLFYRFNMENS